MSAVGVHARTLTTSCFSRLYSVITELPVCLPSRVPASSLRRLPSFVSGIYSKSELESTAKSTAAARAEKEELTQQLAKQTISPLEVAAMRESLSACLMLR